MSMGLMTACVASGPAPMPLAASGPVGISQNGADYIVDLQPTSTGAQIMVVSDAGVMANDQGLVAKQVAESFCSGRGTRLDRRALGRFQTGGWLFDGGCV